MNITSEAPIRVAVVTGASRGIGRAVAERLAADGLAVVVGYAGNTSAAEQTIAAITGAGGRAIAVAGDVADESDMSALFDRAEAEFGGVDVVVHSAGVMTLQPLVDFDLDAFDAQLRTNVRGTFVVDQQAARRIRPGGALINFSSSVPKIGGPGYVAYSATKGAVDAMSRIIAAELRGRDVTVNAVAPGPVATELFLTGKSEELIANIAKLNPFNRLGEPDDIAEVVSFLAGPGRWINGQTLYANGGVA